MTRRRPGRGPGDPGWRRFESQADAIGPTANEAGELPDDQPDERPDPVVAAAAAALRQPVSLDPALDARIMAAVLRQGAPGAQPSGVTEEWAVVPPLAVAPARRGAAAAAWQWLRRPRTVRVSPLGGLAGLAAAAAITFMVVNAGGEPTVTPGSPAATVAAGASPSAAPATAPGATDSVQLVQFVLVAPGARTVALVGDFNDWDAAATPLAASAGRVWSVEVPLVAGRHRYAFVVDGGAWVPDPSAPRAPGADFGEPSSVVTVAAEVRS